VILDELLQRGYQPGSGIPITLIGYSGGGEMAAASAPYLKRATGAPIDVITLGGVMSANNNFLQLEHLYHIVGEKDPVEKAGPIMFPGRWKPFFLSYWNRAKRKGKVSILSAGPIGHQVPGGYMDPKAVLPDGRTNLQHTIETILQILDGQLLQANQSIPRKTSNYAEYQQATFVHPDYYPVVQTVDLALYRPLADWMGRLILPKWENRPQVRGVLFEVYYAPKQYQHLIGEIVNLRWSNDPTVQQLVKAVTRDVHFSADAEYSSQYDGAILPDRINHWRQVDPLESLAGAHPVDDITVMLDGQVEVEEWESEGVEENPSPHTPAPLNSHTLYITNTPIQITGRFYALVQFVQPITGTDQFRVVHFNANTRQFDGVKEIVRLPEVLMAQDSNNYPSTTQDLEKSPLNEMGWYIYGAKDARGMFVVQSLAPRSLFRLQLQRVVFGKKAIYTYVRKQAWADVAAQKGQISSVLGTPRSNGSSTSIQTAISDWQEGDRALLIHNFGGIGGKHKELAASTPIFFGHFAYGVTEVIREPLSNELIFDINYHQIYAQNTDGLISGTLHWSRYMGDRQFGWLGIRPTCDILIKLNDFTDDYRVDSKLVSPLSLMLRQLQVMTARYRIGDGTGSTYVGPANNCAQDSNQALFASIRTTLRYLQEHAEVRQRLLEDDPQQAKRFRNLQSLRQELERQLQPLGAPRPDWEKNEYNLGSTLEEKPLRNLWTGLGSWRTMLPRFASDTIVKVFLEQGATVWVLRTNQVGGNDPDLEPIAPMTL
ncbi:MAG: CAAX protease, partial [Oscillatoriales cyanobacterium C42_A2020_001]|nr:CAAX protease [Leptolyngbyaceae cyanobacterium C42_A2020_001]